MRPAVRRAWWWGYLCGALSVFTVIGIANSPIAKADSQLAEAYAAQYGEAICATLDSHPSFAGIFGIGQAITEGSSLTNRDAGEAIAYAVFDQCPQHLPLLRRFAVAFGPRSVT